MNLLEYITRYLNTPCDIVLCDCTDDTMIADYFARNPDDSNFTDSDACRIADRCTIYLEPKTICQ